MSPLEQNRWFKPDYEIISVNDVDNPNNTRQHQRLFSIFPVVPLPSPPTESQENVKIEMSNMETRFGN